MLFDTSIATAITNAAYTNRSWNSIDLYIYSGVQPSISSFESDFSSNYYYTSDVDFGSSLLVRFVGTTIDKVSTNLILDTAGTSTYLADGTATWALWLNNGLSASTLPSSYMLVPVTNAAGTGVVKLSTTTVSGSSPTISDVSLSMGL